MQRASRRDWIGLGILALPCLLYSMDLTVLDLAIPHLVADLRPSSTELLWIVDIYGFMVAGALIPMGALGDRIGRRRVLMIGALAFGATSVLAALATTATQLILARAVLGVAGATIAPSTLALVNDLFLDPRQRTTAVGIWVASFSAGAAIGPMLGGLVIEHLHWSAVFLLAVPVMAALLVLAPRFLPEARASRAGRIDLGGAALSTAAVLAAIYGAKRVAATGLDLAGVAAIAGSIVLGVAFVRRQRLVADPLLDVGLFRRRSFSVAFAIYGLGAFAAFGTLLGIAQYLQLVLGLDAVEAGLWTAPFAIVSVIGSTISPWLARRIAATRVIRGGLLLAAAGLLVLARLDGASTTQVLIGMLSFGFGMSLAFAHVVDIVVAAAPPERAGSASALAETGGELGGAIGIAILGSIVNLVYRTAMAHAVPAAAVEARQTLGGAIATARELPGPLAHQLLGTARDAFTHGLRVSSAICAVAIVIASAVVAGPNCRER